MVEIIWTLIYLGLWALALISAVIALCSRDRVRHVSINVLLSIVTLIIVWGTASNAPAFQRHGGISKTPVVADEDHTPQPEELLQADTAPASLKGSQYLDGIDSSIKPFLLWEWGKDPDKEIARANAQVEALAKKYPLDAQLATRAIILRHWQGGDALKAIDTFSNGGGTPDQLMLTMYTIYSVPGGGDLSENIKSIEANLSPGWYRDTALTDARKAANAAQNNSGEQTEKTASLFWQTRFITFEILKLLASLAGIYVIYKYLSGPRKDFEPLTTDFQKSYGCLLILPLITSTSMVVHDALAQVATNLSLESLITPVNQNWLLAVSCALVGFYFLICRPAGLNLWQALTTGSEKLDLKELAVLMLAAFCAICALTTIGHFCAAMCTGNLASLTNSAQHAILNNGDHLISLESIRWMLGLVTLVPVVDAIFFQGLAAGYSRHRFGTIAATILSALAFMAWHFHPSYFAEYFALGLVLAAVYLRTNSLIYTAAVHALWNGVLIVLIFFLLS